MFDSFVGLNVKVATANELERVGGRRQACISQSGKMFRILSMWSNVSVKICRKPSMNYLHRHAEEEGEEVHDGEAGH